jgi:hypothetical protein
MEHVLQLYQQESALLERLEAFAAAGLRIEEAVVVIGSTPRWELLLDRLQKSGVDARARVRSGQMRLISAHSALASCMSGAVADRLRFIELLNSTLHLARMRWERVRVFSELTDALWRDGNRAGARALERLWKPLVAHHDAQLLCACPIDSLEGDTYDGTLQSLCEAHTEVRPAFDESGFEEAVSAAVAEVLDEPLAHMLHALATAHRPTTRMPEGQAVLFWLKDHMPRTAEKVLSRARARWSEH